MGRYIFRAKVFVLLLFLFPACAAHQPPNAQIKQFATVTSAGVEEISSYYLELNDYERQLYIEERMLDPTLEATSRTSENQPTPLSRDRFDPAAIQVRIRLLRQLQDYTEGLSTLAGGSQEQSFKQQLSALDGNLTGLKDRIDQVSGGDGKDKDAKKYLDPITSIIGIIGQAIVEKKRADAIHNIIIQGETPVNSALDLLQADMQKYLDSTRLTGEAQRLFDWMTYYNDHRAKMSPQERKETLEHIRQLAQASEILAYRSPSTIVASLKKAHIALVQSARNGNKQSLFEFLKAYQDDIKELVEAIQELRELRKGREA